MSATTRIGDNVVTGVSTPDEQVLWSGRPVQGVRFHDSDFVHVPMGFVTLALAVFVVASVREIGNALWVAAFAAPPFLIAIHFLAGRFVYCAAERARTTYLVTDRRIVIVRRGLIRRVQSLRLGEISLLAITSRGRGEMAITFQPLPFGYWYYQGTGMKLHTPFGGRYLDIPVLELGHDALTAYETIRNALERSRTSGTLQRETRHGG